MRREKLLYEPQQKGNPSMPNKSLHADTGKPSRSDSLVE
jgi:hypothetical protein